MSKTYLYLVLTGVLISAFLIGCDENGPAASPVTQDPVAEVADAEEPVSPPAADAVTEDDYPLDVCLVSGDKLGSMGEVIVVDVEGREVRLCCEMCRVKLERDPSPYLLLLDGAASGSMPVIKSQMGDPDHGGHSHDGHSHDHAH